MGQTLSEPVVDKVIPSMHHPAPPHLAAAVSYPAADTRIELSVCANESGGSLY
jgi:hypothetical protein